MGTALAFDLAQSPRVDELIITDIDETRAQSLADRLTRAGSNVAIQGRHLNVEFYDDVLDTLRDTTVAIGSVSYKNNFLLSTAAIETGTHFLDLGGNNDVVDRQLALDAKAKAAGVLIVPNCGLAPGLVNILAITGSHHFDRVDAIHLRVGGLPRYPRPPLNYQLVFSPEGLLNEYIEPSEVIRDGGLKTVESMTEVEELEFPPPFGKMEAFHTSGGISTLSRRMIDKVNQLDYKTIRYRGHCEKFKVLIDVGFASNEPVMAGTQVRTSREIFIDLLREKLPADGPDVVLLRATVRGFVGETEKSLAYEMIDCYDETNQLTAMMRTTSFPTSVIAQMVLRGDITARGVMPPEECVDGNALIAELKLRNINIRESWS